MNHQKTLFFKGQLESYHVYVKACLESMAKAEGVSNRDIHKWREGDRRGERAEGERGREIRGKRHRRRERNRGMFIILLLLQ